MPSQASIEIASIFEDVITKDLKYCCVCLRTEEERKLVEPEHFMKCLQIMKIQIPLVTICYVCEAESTRAYSLFQAINFASIINQWFMEMASKLNYSVEMPAYLDRHIAKQSRYVGKWPMPEWWRRVRARSDLVQTEVLVVSDASAEEADRGVVGQSIGPTAQRPPGRPPPYIDPDPNSIVIIDDDDDDPLEVEEQEPLEVHEPPGVHEPLEVHQPLQVHEPPPPLQPVPIPIAPLPNIATAPNIIQIDQYLDPSNSITNNLIIPDTNVIIPPNNENLSGYILQPVMYGSDGNYHVFRLESEPQVSQMPEIQNQILNECQNIQIEVITDNSKLFEVGSFESERAQSVGVQTMTEEVEEEGQQKNGGVEKRPVMSGRIDWEDKIPMDVISFVDASDPTILGRRKRYKKEMAT